MQKDVGSTSPTFPETASTPRTLLRVTSSVFITHLYKEEEDGWEELIH